jgi:hypothetical protein
MGWIQMSSGVALGLLGWAGFNGNANAAMGTAAMTNDRSEFAIAQQSRPSGLSQSTILDLKDLQANPSDYDFFTFRPNLEKLILSGDAATEHISILWYTIPDGTVGLHYHAMTESVYTIEGTQADAKGVYPTGSLYFNPPGSGHEVTDSTGFFILAYASPPDFANTDLIEEYTPVQINTADPDLVTRYPFEPRQDGVSVYTIPLDLEGGIRSEFIQSTATQSYGYDGNYVLVLRGHCTIDGTTFGADTLVVATTIETQSYEISAAEGSTCLALGLAFERTP